MEELFDNTLVLTEKECVLLWNLGLLLTGIPGSTEYTVHGTVIGDKKIYKSKGSYWSQNIKGVDFNNRSQTSKVRLISMWSN